jgi:hypothetical protein
MARTGQLTPRSQVALNVSDTSSTGKIKKSSETVAI